MDDIEICDKIFRLRRDRAEEVLFRMDEYDRHMKDQIASLQAQCSHSETKMYSNPIGWACGRECIFCGKVVLDEE